MKTTQKTVMTVVMAALLPFALSSCELFLASMFPGSLPRAQAFCRIWDAFPELVGVSDYDMVLSELHGVRDNVALFIEYHGTRKVALLDSKTLEIEKVLTAANLDSDLDPLLGFMSAVVFGAVPGGNYLIGQHWYDPVAGKFTAEVGSDLTDCVTVFGPSDLLYVKRSSAGAVHYDSLSFTTLSPPSYAFPTTPTGSRIVSGAFIDGSVRLLAGFIDMSGTTRLALSLPYGWSLSDPVILESVNMDVDFDLYKADGVWLTMDGIVIYENPEDGASRLVRFSFTGEEQDSISGSDWDIEYAFMQDGKTFYELDKRSGCLYKSSTWWE